MTQTHEAEEVRRMFANLTDTTKGAVFSVLVLVLAVGAASSINMLGLASDELAWGFLWSITPVVATVTMLLVVTREGYSREGWKSLGLHRPGLGVWWIAFGVTFLMSLTASIVVWATPLASFVLPEGGLADPAINFLINVAILALAFSLWEEIGMRGYLLPKLLPLGRRRALALVGLVHAAWHAPLIFLTPLYHTAGNRLIVLPLFVGTVVAASFVFGYLRIYAGSVWPASIAHAVHNAAWGALSAFTLTSNPVMVKEYLAGDNGILILITTVIGAVLIGRVLRRGMNEARRGGEVPAATEAPATAVAPR
jgi:membrane protease YdiL (CAAX protease family)